MLPKRTASEIIHSLNKWNSKQEFRQKMLDKKIVNTDYRTILKSALIKADSLKSVELFSKAMLN